MMARRHTEPFLEQLLDETRAAERLASPHTRLAGLFMLVMLALWTANALSAFYEMRMLIGFETLSKLIAISQAGPDTTGLGDEAVKTVDDARTVLRERSTRGQSRQSALLEQIKREKVVQAALAALWVVVVTLVGVNMLCAGVGGLIGSRRARKWCRLVVYWSLFALVTTVGSMVALGTWGGFPAIESPSVLVREFVLTRKPLAVTMMMRIQMGLAFLVVIALLFSRTSTASESRRLP